MQFRAPIFWVSLALLAQSACAQALPLEANLEARGLARFTGEFDAEVAAVGVEFYAPTGKQGPQLAASAGSFRYELWDLPYIRYTMESGSPSGAQWYELHLEPELVERGTATGVLETDGEFKDEGLTRVVGHPGDSWPVHIQSKDRMDVGRPIPAGSVPAKDDIVAQLPPEAGRLSLEGAPLRLLSERHETIRGPAVLVLYGVNATLGPHSFTTGRWQDDHYLHAPSAWSHGRLWHRHVLVVSAEDAHIQYFQAEDAPWSFHIVTLEGSWKGDLELSQARGDGTVNGTAIPEQQHLFQVIGEFRAKADYRSSPAHWGLEGQASFLAVDANTIAGHRYAPEQADQLVLAALAGGGLLAFLWKMGPRLLAVLAARSVWDNSHRVHVIRLLTWQPGLSTMEVARRTEMSRASARRHLGRLEAAGWISKHGDAKEASYTLNSGSSTFLVGGSGVPAHEVFQAMHHPAHRTILRAADDDEVDYPRVCGFLVEQGQERMPKSTFSRHAKQMTEAGILERTPEGRRVKWRIVLDLESVRRHYARAFLIHKGCLRVYEALSCPTTPDELYIRMGRRHQFQSSLRTLQALGLVQQENGTLVARPL